MKQNTITENTAGVEAAIEHWSKLAEDKEALALGLSHRGADASTIQEAVTEALQASRTAEALRMELRTGTPHCGCTSPPHARH